MMSRSHSMPRVPEGGGSIHDRPNAGLACLGQFADQSARPGEMLTDTLVWPLCGHGEAAERLR